MKEWQLATGSWHDHDPALGLAVGISVLRPSGKRYPAWADRRAPYPYMEGSRDLWPRSNWPKFKEWQEHPWSEMGRLYVERLDARKPQIERFLDSLHETYPGTTICLLCHEHRPLDCHRSWLARWIKTNYGLVVREEHAPDPDAPEIPIPPEQPGLF